MRRYPNHAGRNRVTHITTFGSAEFGYSSKFFLAVPRSGQARSAVVGEPLKGTVSFLTLQYIVTQEHR